MDQLIEKVLELYRNADSTCVFYNSKACDTDNTTIFFENSSLEFEFQEDDIKDFRIKFSEIKEIVFESVQTMTNAVIKLKDGDCITISTM